MKTNDIEMRRALAFATLCGKEQVMGKAPSYLMEKWKMVQTLDEPEQMLDHSNRAIGEQWFEKWKTHFDKD